MCSKIFFKNERDRDTVCAVRRQKKVSHETRENREKAEKEKRAPQLECFSVLS